MRRSIEKPPLVLAVALLCGQISAYAQSKKSPLRLTTSIISQEYNNSRVDFCLRLRFTNTGDRPLIIDTSGIGVLKVGVFEDVERPTINTFSSGEAAVDWFPHDDGWYSKLNSSRPTKDFAIIPPGGVYQREESFIAPVLTRGRKEVTFPGIDSYLLQIKVAMWLRSYTAEAAKARMGRRWRRLGLLWTEDLLSNPMPFSVERKQSPSV